MELDIFDNNNSELFRNRYVLSADYIPEHLVARDQEIRDIVNLVRPVLTHDAPKNALVFGKTGTGKTVVIKYVIKKLYDKIKKFKLNVVPIFINCKEFRTVTQIIVRIINDIAPEISIPHSGFATGEYYNNLWKIINQKGLTIIIIFDEIDQLKDHNILYSLSRARENMHINNNIFMGIIGISNDLFFIEKLDPRIISSFGSRSFVFPPYNADQISEILKNRANMAFKNGILAESVIPMCAALSAQEHGDARKALMLLEIAGEIAEHEQAKTITENHIKHAYDKINTECIIEMVKSLPIQSKLVLYSVIKLSKRSKSSLTTGEVNLEYCELCNKINIKNLSRSGVSALISELDLMGIINASIHNRGRYGTTRNISINNPTEKIESAILSDYRFD